MSIPQAIILKDSILLLCVQNIHVCVHSGKYISRLNIILILIFLFCNFYQIFKQFSHTHYFSALIQLNLGGLL